MSRGEFPRRALIFHNPGFEADVMALLAACPTTVEVRTFSTIEIGAQFLRLFPAAVLGLDVSVFRQARFARARKAWVSRARSLIADLYATFQFEVALAPADDTPYWHEIAVAIEELGVPFVVLFKETTHPPGQLRTFAPVIRAYVPVTAQHVLVNSRRTAEYMIACGAAADSVTIIGQPRFDEYATGVARDGSASEARGILFFSYEADAYIASGERAARADALNGYLAQETSAVTTRWPSPIDETWLPLRCITERVLVQCAAREGRPLVVKPHRQMSPIETSFDRRFVEAEAQSIGVSVRYVDATEPLGPLFKSAGVVVGFQTTALLEAMLLGKHVVYAAWGGRLDESDDQLVPFASWSDVIEVCRSPEELAAAVVSSRDDDAAKLRPRRELAEDWLGPIDGLASARAWTELARIRASRVTTDAERARRVATLVASAAHRRRAIADARTRELVWSLLGGVVVALTVVSGTYSMRARARITQLVAAARERRLELVGAPASRDVAGPFDAPLIIQLRDLVGNAGWRFWRALAHR